MNIAKKFLCLLAIFCILGSCIAAVSAADDFDGGYAGYQSDDYMTGDNFDGGYAGYQYDDFDGAYADSLNNGTDDDFDGGYAGYRYNETLENMSANATAHVPAAGEPVSNATNTTVAAAQSTMPATGNPIMILFGVMAVLGGAAVLKRKN